jgi:hypothetical protein
MAILTIITTSYHFFCDFNGTLVVLILYFLDSLAVVRASFSALGSVNIRILLLLFPNPWHTVELIFSELNLANIETRFCFFLISTMNFEKATSYFSTSNPAFSQNYVHRVELTFSSRISFTVINFSSFRNEFIFRLLPSQKTITMN